MQDLQASGELQLQDVPVHLKDAKRFAWGWFAVYPFGLLVSGALVVDSFNPLAILSSQKALNLMGIVSTFYSAGLVAWEYFHLDDAREKVRECIHFDRFLDGQMALLKGMQGSRKGLLYNEIREYRSANQKVKQKALEYEGVRNLFLKTSFYLFGFSAILQVAGNV